MSMVWPCPLTVDAYASMGRAVKVPRPECPSCLVPVVFWSGYWRHVRRPERERKIFIPRVRCRACGVSHALLPAFVLARRLDAAEPVGAVIGQVAGGAYGVRRAAAAAGVPHTTARGWVRRFAARAGELAVSFCRAGRRWDGGGSPAL
jgi:transposase-like protein